MDRQGWSAAHARNKRLVQDAIRDGGVDVVFLGDQTVQAWDGMWLDRPAPDGRKIAFFFNQTFHNPDRSIQGLPLGIYGDRVSQSQSVAYLVPGTTLLLLLLLLLFIVLLCLGFMPSHIYF